MHPKDTMNIVKKLRTLLFHARYQFYLLIVLAMLLHALIWYISPQQGPVVLYKAGLAMLAAIMGFGLDFILFPYSRPDSYLCDDWKNDPDACNYNGADYPIAKGYASAFNTATLRRAIIIVGFVLGISLGL